MISLKFQINRPTRQNVPDWTCLVQNLDLNATKSNSKPIWTGHHPSGHQFCTPLHTPLACLTLAFCKQRTLFLEVRKNERGLRSRLLGMSWYTLSLHKLMKQSWRKASSLASGGTLSPAAFGVPTQGYRFSQKKDLMFQLVGFSFACLTHNLWGQASKTCVFVLFKAS